MELNKYLKGIKAGEEKSFEDLFKKIHSSICYYAYYLINDYSVAEDIVEDVLLNIWNNRENINIKSSLKSYIFKSVHNQAINVLLNRKIKKNSVNELISEEKWQFLMEVIICDDEIIEKIESQETENRIHEIINTLPEQRRKIFILSRFEGKTNLEIADSLNISVSTVKTHIYRALESIKTIFD